MQGKGRQLGKKGYRLSSSKSFSLWEGAHRRVLIDWQTLILPEHPSSQLRPLVSQLATGLAPWGAVAGPPFEGQLGSTWLQHSTEVGMLSQENTHMVTNQLKLLSPLLRQSIMFSAQERPNVYWLWVLVQVINPMLHRGWSQMFSRFSKLGWTAMFHTPHTGSIWPLSLDGNLGWRATECYCGRALSIHVHKFRIWRGVEHHLRQACSARSASCSSEWTLLRTAPCEINPASLAYIELHYVES